uniref:Uncharacterized protein n=1 Tax=Spironucleus salmonicida TaxID=348837 RepID=V6M684_9EUKA|eukprot:EST44209.1 Hypothetical protein SS50377_16017 [Spironucleus salmonicida]
MLHWRLQATWQPWELGPKTWLRLHLDTIESMDQRQSSLRRMDRAKPLTQMLLWELGLHGFHGDGGHAHGGGREPRGSFTGLFNNYGKLAF